jgi:hypothetical protein
MNENYFEFTDDFGWVEYKNSSRWQKVEILNGTFFSFLENQGSRILFSESKAPYMLLFFFFALFGFVSSSSADVGCRLREFAPSSGFNYIAESIVNYPTVSTKLKVLKKGRRLGTYCESFSGKMIMNVYENEILPTFSSVKSLKYIPQFNNLSNISKTYKFDFLKNCRCYKTTKVPTNFISFFPIYLIPVTSILITIPWYIPLPPFFRSTLTLVKEALKFLRPTKTDRDGDYNNFESIFKGLGGLPGFPRIAKKDRLQENISFLPGTIVLILLGFLKRKNLDTMVSGILENTGVIKKKTFLNKLSSRFGIFFDPRRPNVYILLTASGVIYLVYANRERILATAASSNPIVLGFDFLNNLFREYQNILTASVTNAHKISNDVYARVWNYAEKESKEILVLKQELKDLSIENKDLNRDIYSILRSADKNEISANQCTKELSIKQMDLIKLNTYISDLKAPYPYNPLIDKSVGSGLSEKFNSKNTLTLEEEKIMIAHLENANALAYPVLKIIKNDESHLVPILTNTLSGKKLVDKPNAVVTVAKLFLENLSKTQFDF